MIPYKQHSVLIKILRKVLSMIVIALLFLPVNSSAQTKSQIRDRKIKSATIHWNDARKGSTEQKSQITKYDKHGNPIEELEYNNDGSIDRWIKYSYQKNIKTVMRLDSAGNIKKKTVTQRDKWGNVVEESSYGADGILIESTVSEYNRYNDQISESTYDKSGKLSRKSVYMYDNKGLLKSKEIFDENGKLIYTRTYSYQY